MYPLFLTIHFSDHHVNDVDSLPLPLLYSLGLIHYASARNIGCTKDKRNSTMVTRLRSRKRERENQNFTCRATLVTHIFPFTRTTLLQQNNPKALIVTTQQDDNQQLMIVNIYVVTIPFVDCANCVSKTGQEKIY